MSDSTANTSLTHSNTNKNITNNEHSLSEPLLNTNKTKNTITNIDYGDRREHMTYARRLSRWLSRYAWYYPVENRPPREAVSLDKGWEYFEHVTLARHFYNENENNPNETSKEILLEKAEPGEHTKPTRLYGVCSTPALQLGDFGIGIGIYFDTTRRLAVIVFIAGLLSMYNLWYYAGPDYSDYQSSVTDYASGSGDDSDGSPDYKYYLLLGSAICDTTFWAPCTTAECTESKWSDDGSGAEDRFATDASGALKFALRNDCLGAEYEQGMTQFGIIVFLAVMLQIMSIQQSKTEVALDEDQQTAQDYSVVVDGCPPDAVDPDEWKDFFEDVSDGKVTVVTVAINNAELLDTLVQHKLMKQELKYPDFLMETKKLRWKHVGAVPMNSAEMREFVQDIPPLAGFDKL